jgi:putative ABC transport system permease protein
MLKLAFRGLAARKLRTALTSIAVVLGVAFVAGTFMFTDTIDAAFKDLFERSSKGTDVSVTARETVESEEEQAPPVPSSVLDRVRDAPGVAEAEGVIDSEVSVLDDKGDRVGQGWSAVSSVRPDRFEPTIYPEGRAPRSSGEIAIDEGTADRESYELGQSVTVAGEAPAKRYRIVGFSKVEGFSGGLGGAVIVTATLPEAQRIADKQGRYDEIVVAADQGTSPNELKAGLKRELGSAVTVRTGKEMADERAADIGEALGFIRTALLVFGGVAVLVGGFLIFNTFSITVAQRSREFALLRTLGASRKQLMRSVVVEAVVIGLGAGAIGIVAGLGLAIGLRELMAAVGLELPSTSMVVGAGTIVIGLIVGLAATLVASLAPARRATRVDPMEAMRESVLPGTGPLRRRRLVTAALLALAGLVILVLGVSGSAGDGGSAAAVIGAGALLVLLGVALLAPVLVRPLARVVGTPLERLQGLTGRLARENAERQPQRTAVTAAALMIGLALVVFVAVFAAGLKGTFEKAIDDNVHAAVVVAPEGAFDGSIPVAAADAVRRAPGVAEVAELRDASGRVQGVSGAVNAASIDPAAINRLLDIELKSGSAATIARLRDDQAIVKADWAKSNGLQVGDTAKVTTRTGRRVDYTIIGTYDDKVGFLGDFVITNTSMQRDWDVNTAMLILVGGEPGTDGAQLEATAKAALREFPTAEPQTLSEWKDSQTESLNSLLGLVYGLLSLSVVVALLGIVNTLALSVFERTRELGMLRAVGMTRRQVRRMIRGEAVITALIGAALGLVLGIAFAVIAAQPLMDEGFTFEVPWLTLVGMTVAAAVAGTIAAIAPARRAARVDVLRAVTTE